MFDEKSHSLKMDKSIEAFTNELSSLRTGRANAAMLDLIKVDVYDTPLGKRFIEALKDNLVKKRILERQSQENRADDNEEIAIKRYQTYEKSSEPVLHYYKQSNLLKVVNGETSISDINSEISGLIDTIKG